MTLEGCVVRISDILAYVGRDDADAIAAGLLSPDAFDDGRGGAYNSWILTHASIDIVEHSYGKPRIEMSEDLFEGNSPSQARELREDPMAKGRYRRRFRGGAARGIQNSTTVACRI